MTLLESLKGFIQENSLFSRNDKILLGVSGGIDSVVMLDMLLKLKIDIGVAHCNFELRKSDSVKDESFVKKLALDHSLEFHCKSFNTKKYATAHNMSVQEAARVLRYTWFEEVRSGGYDHIAVAHHSNDRIETYLLNMIRGTGIAGYHSLQVKNGFVVRPLLTFSKDQIIEYARSNKLKYRKDLSNDDLKYRRNKVRNEVLPLLAQINPSIEKSILENIDILQETNKIYRGHIDMLQRQIVVKHKNSWRISIAKLVKLDPLKTYLFEFLKEFQFNSSVVDEVANSLSRQSGKKFMSATHSLVKDRDFLIISERTASHQKKPTIITQKLKSIKTPIRMSMRNIKINHFELTESQQCASLDTDKLKYPLRIRKWKRGDFFYPLGMKQKKKLSDFFIDNKISVIEKENIFVVESGSNIAWIIGHRIDDRYKVTKKTKYVYHMELNNGREG